VLITSFDLDNEHEDKNQRRWKPKFFHNFPGEDSDGSERAAARAQPILDEVYDIVGFLRH